MTNGVCQRTLPLYSSYVEKRTTPEKPLCQNETTAVRSQTYQTVVGVTAALELPCCRVQLRREFEARFLANE